MSATMMKLMAIGLIPLKDVSNVSLAGECLTARSVLPVCIIFSISIYL